MVLYQCPDCKGTFMYDHIHSDGELIKIDTLRTWYQLLRWNDKGVSNEQNQNLADKGEK